MPATMPRVTPTKAISSVSQLIDTPSNSTSDPTTKLTVAMPVHTRGTPVCTSTA